MTSINIFNERQQRADIDLFNRPQWKNSFHKMRMLSDNGSKLGPTKGEKLMNLRVQPIETDFDALKVDLRQIGTLTNIEDSLRPDASVRPIATPITVAHGDGIGPEIMNASLRILLAAGANIAVEPIDVGEPVFKKGHSAGIDPQAWESVRRTRVLYKAPITAPQGGGYKSLNVTIRKTFGLFANVRPCTAYHPFVSTKHPDMDVVIIRENEEDLYAGIEHRQTDQVYQCLKIVSRPGCERIVRFAFEYAVAHGRHSVACFTKDNIMKMTDGLFHEVFDEIGAEYPHIERRHWIVDAGAAKLADEPNLFDVIVMPNLYGDILSDVAAELAGSVGLAPSANIGAEFAMFEAVHGSAPQLANENLANPSGLLLAGVMMLVHIGQAKAAETVHNAWLKTVEDGIHTFDMFTKGRSKKKVGTAAFAEAVIDRLGHAPERLVPVRYEGRKSSAAISVRKTISEPIVVAEKKLVGVDVFTQWSGQDPNMLADLMQRAQGSKFELVMITNRGVMVWPRGMPETLRTDHWRCRYMVKPGSKMTKAMIALLQMKLIELDVDFIKTEHLYTFGGEPGYSLGQGQ
jgi:isocitrate dehydrogenase